MSAESASIRQLSAALVRSAELTERPGIQLPDPETLDLPEKVVQFGTGAFLRGFVGSFIDEANRQRRFGGRIAAVGSTGSGREQTLTRQDGLYTLVTKGVSRGVSRSSQRVIATYSRALSAQSQWSDVLALARRPELELVFSNTTEAGIVLDPEDSAGPTPSVLTQDPSPQRVEAGRGGQSRGAPGRALQPSPPPRSFPGKLTMFLYERGRTFGYAMDRSVVVLPCELIENNGGRLREIVLTLARRWRLDPEFIEWIERAVPFCNTLVDRIVPGTPDASTLERAWTQLGYRDDLLTVCEDYRLFVIQADAAVRERLAFADADPAIVVTTDVTPFRERKVRLLNGAHTLLAPVGILCGCRTVKDAIDDPVLGAFVRGVLLDELAPSVDAEAAEAFARDVLDRFANPFLDHALSDITLQQTTKLGIRVIPSLAAYTHKTGRTPTSVAFGLAAWLFYMRPDAQERRRRDAATHRTDDRADHVAAIWKQTAMPLPLAGGGSEGGPTSGGADARDPANAIERLSSDAVPTRSAAAAQQDDTETRARASALVRAVLADASLWGDDLTRVPGLAGAVTEHLAHIERDGARAALEHHLAAIPVLGGRTG